MRTQRAVSEFDIYHIMARGVGKLIIFEDDKDRQRFLDLLIQTIHDEGGSLLAWCLMDNHFHALVQLELDCISRAMQKLLSTYALYFNTRHGRSGHLFQDRFKSEAIDSEQYLLTVVRYIHANPIHALKPSGYEYPWSSYRCYLSESGKCDTKLILGIMGSVEEFRAFHALGEPSECIDVLPTEERITDEEAKRRADMILKGMPPCELASLDKRRRDNLICALRSQRLTIKQIQRLTGIGRGIIDRAWRNRSA